MRQACLVFLVFLVSSVSAVEEVYPRPWDDAGWVSENRYISDLGLWELWWTPVNPHVNLSEHEADSIIYAFQPSLEGLGLNRLCPESRETASEQGLGDAAYYKSWADKATEGCGMESLAFGPLGPAACTKTVIDYVGNWKQAMGRALDGLGDEAGALNAKRAELQYEIEFLENQGVCEAGYSGPGTGYCYVVVDDVDCDYSGIWEHVPETGWLPECVRKIWDAESALDEKCQNISNGWGEMQGQLGELRSGAYAEQAEALAKEEMLEYHRLDKITVGPQEAKLGEGRTIAQRYLMLKGELAEAQDLIEGISKSDAYAEQYNGMADAYSLFSEANWEGDSLLEDAQEVVDGAGAAATAAMEEASYESSEGGGDVRALQTAETHCYAAESTDRLGEAYYEFSQCRYYSELAKKSEEPDLALEVLKAELDGMIANAGRDGIDTARERTALTMIELYGGRNSYSVLSNLKEGLLEKAGVQYLGLPAKREETLKMIAAGGSEWEYLYAGLVGEDCYYGEMLDYACALGSLRDMDETYDAILEEALAKRQELVENSLEVTALESVGFADLHGPSPYVLSAIIENPLSLWAENVEVKVPTEAELRGIDIIEGAERVKVVSWSGSKATIRLKNISPKETITIVFSTELWPCRKTSSRREAIGALDGSAEISEITKVYCSIPVDGIFVGEGDKAYVDGVGASVNDGAVNRKLSNGAHTVDVRWTDANAYSLWQEQEYLNTVGGKTTVEYSIVIQPEIDLETLPVMVDEQDKSPQKIEAYSYTGETISNKHYFGSGGMYFEVKGLDAGEEARVRVKYEFTNEDEVVAGKISELSGEDLVPEQQEALDEAIAASTSGDYDTALEKLEDIESGLEKAAKEWEKIVKKDGELRYEINRKMQELSSGLEMAEGYGISNEYTGEMEARLSSLNNSLYEELSEGMLESPLSAIDMGWEGKELKELEKEIKNRENGVKTRWAETDIMDGNASMAITRMEGKIAAYGGEATFPRAFEAIGAIEEVEGILDAMDAEIARAGGEAKGVLESAVEATEKTLDKYKEQYDALPEGHWLRSIFKKGPSWIEKRLGELKGAEDAGSAMLEVAGLEAEMQAVLDFLGGESGRSLENAKSLVEDSRDLLDSQLADEIDASIERAEEYAGHGDYAKSIMLADDATSKIGEGEGDDGAHLIIMALTAMLVLGIVSIFMLRGSAGKHVELPGIMGKKKKGYKRLRQAD